MLTFSLFIRRTTHEEVGINELAFPRGRNFGVLAGNPKYPGQSIGNSGSPPPYSQYSQYSQRRLPPPPPTDPSNEYSQRRLPPPPPTGLSNNLEFDDLTRRFEELKRRT